MQFTPQLLPELIESAAKIIDQNADEVTALDQAIGDGDHVTNLQRGLNAISKQSDELAELQWNSSLQKLGMTLLSTMGGASGSLFGTLFISMSKAVQNNSDLNRQDFSSIFTLGVDAVKKRGKADAGEKTMLDVLIPVANQLQQEVKSNLSFAELLDKTCLTAQEGMESTKDMLATKGRASYLAEKSIGHIDAGARTSQLIICTICNTLKSYAD